MNKKFIPYIMFGSGLSAGSLFSMIAFLKMTEKIKAKMEKVETVSKLVLDMDKWMWETIDNEVDTEVWVDELKDRLNYIEMVIALYYMED